MARGWKHKVEIFHLFTDDQSHTGLQASLSAIADKLKKDPHFAEFNFSKFYELPEGDEFFGPAEYADKLMGRLYDFCDANRIWVKPG